MRSLKIDKANSKIRQSINDSGLYCWQVAQEIEVDPSTLCRWLREELKGERLESVTAAIEKLKGGNLHDRKNSRNANL